MGPCTDRRGGRASPPSARPPPAPIEECPKTDGSELRSLTGIRGAAAIGVVLYHLGEAMEQRFGVEAFGLFRKGYIAVDLFFVLSGFIIAYNYQHLFSRGVSAAAYAAFIGKRVARLYPLYLVLTFAYFVKNTARATDPAQGPPTPADWAANLTMTHSWGFDAVRILGVSWSISTEFFVYFLFPFLAFALSRWRSAPFILAGLSASALLAVAGSGRGVNGSLDVVAQGSFLPLLRCIAGFSLGLLAFRVVRDRAGRLFLSPDAPLVLAGAAAAAALAFGLDVLVALLAFPLIVAVLASGSRLGDRLFANAHAHRLGEWSYAIYLVHFLCINPALGLAERLQSAASIPLAASALVLTMVPVLAASALLYRFVEKPGRRLVLSAFAGLHERKGRRSEPSGGG